MQQKSPQGFASQIAKIQSFMKKLILSFLFACTVLGNFSLFAAEGYLPSCDAIYYCQKFLNIKDGRVETFNLTQQEAEQMGIAPSDFAEIEKSIAAVAQKNSNSGNIAEVELIWKIKSDYLSKLSEKFKATGEFFSETAAHDVLTNYVVKENGKLSLSVSSEEAAKKGISESDYSQYVQSLATVNEAAAKQGIDINPSSLFHGGSTWITLKPIRCSLIQYPSSAVSAPAGADSLQSLPPTDLEAL